MGLIKKLLILAIIIWGVFVFYKKFIAPVIIPFFEEHRGKVDFFGTTTPTIDRLNKGKEGF